MISDWSKRDQQLGVWSHTTVDVWKNFLYIFYDSCKKGNIPTLVKLRRGALQVITHSKSCCWNSRALTKHALNERREIAKQNAKPKMDFLFFRYLNLHLCIRVQLERATEKKSHFWQLVAKRTQGNCLFYQTDRQTDRQMYKSLVSEHAGAYRVCRFAF